MCAPAGRASQLAQEKPLVQLAGLEQATSGLEEVLAKVDSWRSTSELSHFGHRTPSAFAPMDCRRENMCPQAPHWYS